MYNPAFVWVAAAVVALLFLTQLDRSLPGRPRASLRDRLTYAMASFRYNEVGGVATMTPPAGPRPGDEKHVIPVVPFTRAAREHVEPFLDRTVTAAAFTAGATTVGPEDVAAFGYLRHIFVQVDFTGGAGGAAVLKEDAPFSFIQQLQLTDVNGTPIVQLTGYELYLANKFGGYAFSPDPKSSAAYTAIDANGNGTFVLRIPVEISARDALGALSNQNAAQTYKVLITTAPRAEVFSTPPAGTTPDVRIRCLLEAWTQPPATDLRGMPQETTPPAHGTVQNWSRFVRNITAGQQTITLPRVGNLIRTLVMILRTTAPARTTTNFPDPIQLQLDGQILLNVTRNYLRHLQTERYGFAAASLETGVFVLDFTHDFDGHPGGELRDLYIPTTQGTRLDLVGSFGADGTLTVLTNDVLPTGQIYVPAA